MRRIERLSAITAKAKTKTLICVGLIAITFLAFLPALKSDFIAYDDQQYVTENPHVQAGLTAGGFAWAFGYHASNWHPVTWLSHMLDCQIYGLRPWGHHLTNLLLHIANTVLLFLFLQRMTRFLWRSAFVAALFAWHPAHVESVAWIAERKDLLCCFFWLLALHAYVTYAVKPRPGPYLACLGFFILGAMSKPMIVTLPFVLLLMDYWPLRRFRLPGDRNDKSGGLSLVRLLTEKAPFFIIAVLACYVTVVAQKGGYSVVSTSGLPIIERIGHGWLAYQHYTGQAILPHGLAVYYPYDTHISATRELIAILLISTVTIAALVVARRYPFFAVGWLWFLGTLVPVIGLVQVGDQAWADRYTYVPFIGIFIAAVWGISEVQTNRRLITAIGCGSAACFLVMTFYQATYWRNTRELFEHAYKVDPNNHMAITVLGTLDAQQGNLAAAKSKYLQALNLRPGYPEAEFFLANAYEAEGKSAQAIAGYEKVLWYKPIQSQTHFSLGVSLTRLRRTEDAIGHYRAALAINPESALAHNNLAALLQSRGQFDEAITHYSAALKLDQKLARAHNNLGILCLQNGRVDEGIAHLRQALRIDPENRETDLNLAMALNQQGNWSEAEKAFAKNVSSGNHDPKIVYQYGKALARQGKARQALAQFAAALLSQPDYPEALDEISWILATSADAQLRNGPEAVKMAERAVELTHREDPRMLKTLAAAYAETGRFSEAVQVGKLGLNLGAKRQNTNLLGELKTMLAAFQENKPWRQ
jgi:tetratricopeptide (TPR) repeat protein